MNQGMIKNISGQVSVYINNQQKIYNIEDTIRDILSLNKKR